MIILNESFLHMESVWFINTLFIIMIWIFLTFLRTVKYCIYIISTQFLQVNSIYIYPTPSQIYDLSSLFIIILHPNAHIKPN